jgi:hypothetical protein
MDIVPNPPHIPAGSSTNMGSNSASRWVSDLSPQRMKLKTCPSEGITSYWSFGEDVSMLCIVAVGSTFTGNLLI